MKKILAIAFVMFFAGSVFGQDASLDESIKELEAKLDSLKALKYERSSESLNGLLNNGWLQVPQGALNYIPDTLMKYYQDWNSLPYFDNDQPFNWYKEYRGDGLPGYPVPETPLPKHFDKGVPYYDGLPELRQYRRMIPDIQVNPKPVEPNERRSVPVPDFPDWKMQEIIMKSERS